MSFWVEILRWLLALCLFGLAGFPFAFHFLRFLPSRGVPYARLVGLVLVGFGYWLLCTLGLIANDLGGLLLVFVLFLIPGLALLSKNWGEIVIWEKTNARHWLICEVIFLAAFALLIAFRLADPNIAGTEKPMEMTFINGILHSETFPPQDPWLAGYAISYYYFGYLLTALLIRLSGVLAESGFNLMLASVYGLAAMASYAILTDLLQQRSTELITKIRQRFSAFLAPVFLLLCGNLEGLFEVLYARGLFWKADGTSAFWQWVGLAELNSAPTFQPTWNPTNRPGIWWWRASRVITDTKLDGSTREIIDEFPFFSFYLGDLHPHVIGIPFVLLAVAVALNTFFYQKQAVGFPAEVPWFTRIIDRVLSADFWFSAVCVGSLIFMNTWDFPIYFAIFCGASLLPALSFPIHWKKLFLSLLEIAVPFGAACVGLYYLFLSGLSSQAGGLIPSGVFKTRTIQFLIMFGGMILILCGWLILTGRERVSRQLRSKAVQIALVVMILLVAVETILFSLLATAPALAPALQRSSNARIAALGSALQLGGTYYADIQGLNGSANPMTVFLLRKVETLPVAILLFGSLALILMILFNRREDAAVADTRAGSNDAFTALLLLLGFGLILIPEFFYLRDFFGWRMNTIFKFYYQVWILFSLAAAYGFDAFLRRKKRVLIGLSVVLIVCSLIYPFWGIQTKLGSLASKARAGQANPLTLDGSRFMQLARPDDWAGIEWLRNADAGYLVEKVGSSYTSDNAVSTFSGKAALLGPTNHESQWRGGSLEIGTREADVRQIYEARDWTATEALLSRYNVRYVFVGSAERSAYQVQEQKFARHLTLVFTSGACKIYQVY